MRFPRYPVAGQGWRSCGGHRGSVADGARVVGIVVATVVAFVFFDGPLRWAIVAGGVLYEVVETYAFVRWSRRRHPQVGSERMLGARAVVATSLDPHGQVMVDGERWRAVAEVTCAVGSEVEIIAVDGLELTVRPLDG